MKTKKEKNDDVAGTTEERQKLMALGKKLEKLKKEQFLTWVEARKIIGFVNIEPQGEMDDDDDLRESWGEGDSPEMVFVRYAERAWTRWLLDEAVENIKSLAARLDMGLDDIDWSGNGE